MLESYGKIVGFIIFHIEIWNAGNVGFIDELVIDKKFQGKGYGKILMNFAEKYTKKRRAKSYGLWTNRRSKAFKIYEKLGYNELKETVFMVKKAK